MPLYKHASGERVRTVTDSAEDQRLAADNTWQVDTDQPAPKPKAPRATTGAEVTP